jgi:glutamyl-tRNA synthetase
MSVALHRTRLAPSPTGALHLGNARTFLINWALARRENQHILLRVEDLDSPRVKQGSDREAIDILTWLGLDWDSGPVYQSADLTPYHDAMDRLCGAALAYPSPQSRGEVQAASAPQEGSHEVPFPASLRPDAITARAFDDLGANWRLVVEPGETAFLDGFAGPQRFDVSRIVGDFLLWTRRGVPAYQLAVVVDDARQGITHIVRGDDLLDSTARQILIARALGLDFAPAYLHLPLVRGPDGRRLAKRHGDTRLASYRAAGVAPERIIGLLAAWSGVLPRHAPASMTAAEFRGGLDPTRIPRDAITMTPEDAQWLQADARSR